MEIINCDFCNRKFKRAIKHINNNKKRGRKNYCKVCRYKAHSESISGKNHPMYNKNHTLEAKRKIHLSRIGKYLGKDNPNYGNHKLAGENNPMYGVCGKNSPRWKGCLAKTSKIEKERKSFKNKQFIKDTLKRDNYTCQTCGKRGGKLAVDHIMPWAIYPKLRQDHKNVRVLCVKTCHLMYGANPKCKPIKWATSPINMI